jgi:hypothetical protein
VTIRVVNRRDKLVKKAILAAIRVDSTQRYVFLCDLAKGAYRFTVAATDAAGNRGTAAATNVLVVR